MGYLVKIYSGFLHDKWQLSLICRKLFLIPWMQAHHSNGCKPKQCHNLNQHRLKIPTTSNHAPTGFCSRIFQYDAFF